ncbi:hypothetical protein sos41_40420 [Alphaproteobacteria bacterium SO-S41]|nr:hypothetical protein sos41_40420 [Alphaproteobacteria bacterium SO-S41]
MAPPAEATETPAVTRLLAARAASLAFSDIPDAARRVAKQCLLDWVGVALGGRDADLVGMLRADADAEGQGGDCTIIGQAERRPAYQAALINGAMGHALDYDDVIFMGHPTAPVAPAVLAVAERAGASGRDVLTAFIAGFEAECCVGRYVGGSHYAKGWHSTATLGTFGAAAAAGRLLGLTPELMQHALGLAATQAAGLKSMFGSMTKPFHAGHAAECGMRAARLARIGFTANPNAVESPQGFGDTQSLSVDAEAALASPPGGYHVVDTLFKYHAACYLTHSAIEAAGSLRAVIANDPDAVEHAVIRVDPGHLSVCNIEAPETGLATKFSLRMTVALALSGEDTSDGRLFTDATAVRPDLVALRRRIAVEPTARGTRSEVLLLLRDGRSLQAYADVAVPMRDLGAQQVKLDRKFMGLAASALGAARADSIRAMIAQLEEVDDIRALTSLLRPEF